MTQIPCPNCGELLACGDEAIGRRVRCPRCRAMLRLDADSEGRPAPVWPRRRFSLLRLAIVLGVFLAGLAIGFQWGASAAQPNPNGVSATSVGFFGASNTVIVEDNGPANGSPSPKPGAPAGDR